ncbi:acyltransferase [Winogradskyella sp. PG-2]|uniref:acyltransferase n=1 Tax=Winogradskyella sp. PG-2 TaxID=754409 RepID=UPI00045881C1|nr:acyltransferase [Winogradskyella sp. PG-2]BAO74411.1 acetyltransferase [Winogradskyella sp. PG-2]
MRRIIKKLLLKLLGKSFFVDLIDVSILNDNLKIFHVEKLKEHVVLGHNSFMYIETTVFNLKKDAEKILIGENTHVRGELLLFKYGKQLTIGSNCFIGSGTKVWCGEEIRIGNSVLISHGCNIIDSNSHEIDHMERDVGYRHIIKNGHSKEKGSIKTAPIVIKDNVWISFNVIVLKGVTIGKGAIVASGSVVTKDVDDWTMVAGNPAIKIKELRDAE